MSETVSSPDNHSSEGESSLSKNLKSKSIWMRLFFMLVVAFLYSLSRVVMGAVVAVQFFWVLFTTEKNENLMALGESLATYAYQSTRYLTFNTEERPFPFDTEWPQKGV